MGLKLVEAIGQKQNSTRAGVEGKTDKSFKLTNYYLLNFYFYLIWSD
jgi:hypothetical protein